MVSITASVVWIRMKIRGSSFTKLSAPAFKALVSVLENVDRPLGELCACLWDSVAATASHLAIGASIAALLQDELLPDPPQRLVAIYVLYDMIVSRHVLTNTATPYMSNAAELFNTSNAKTSMRNSVDVKPPTGASNYPTLETNENQRQYHQQQQLRQEQSQKQQQEQPQKQQQEQSQQQKREQPYQPQQSHSPEKEQQQRPQESKLLQEAQYYQQLQSQIQHERQLAQSISLQPQQQDVTSDSNSTSRLLLQNTAVTGLSSAIDRLVDSPLTIILFELSDDGEKRLPEQLFLSHLLNHSQTATHEAAVPAQISQAPAATLWNALEGAMRSGAAVPKLNISSVRSLWTARHPEPAHDRESDGYVLPPVSGVVLDADIYSTSEPGHLYDDLGAVVTLEDFIPEFTRIPPPVFPIAVDARELRWIDPEPLHEVVWDPDVGMRVERGAELRDLLARALKSPISDELRKHVVTQLESDPKLVHLCELTPQKLPDLVQNNSTLATEMLLRLASSKQMPQYLDALASMNMNFNSMEVVNCLSRAVKLPTDFVHSYISNGIRSCGDIPDKSAQVRMARCVCMFLKNLMKNKTIDVQNHYIEVQEFCMEYSRIREVADLFRALKSYSAQQ